MSARVLISDQARNLLEKEQERRIQAKWKRGYSLEQIASEAILWYARYGPDHDAFRDDNSIVKEAGF
jgi:uncharacterized protein YodC (DUF2158 family)